MICIVFPFGFGKTLPFLLPCFANALPAFVRPPLAYTFPAFVNFLTLKIPLNNPPGGGRTATGFIKTTQVNNVRGWKVGNPTNNLTKTGKAPKWSTVRKRYWKNEAHLNSDRFAKSTKNLERAKKGLAPQKENPKTGKMESIELHHIPPKRDGGLFDFIEVTPQQHAMLDECRHLGE